MTRHGRPPKLTRADVEAMRRHRAEGITADALAAVFRVARSTVLRYLRGDCKAHRT